LKNTKILFVVTVLLFAGGVFFAIATITKNMDYGVGDRLIYSGIGTVLLVAICLGLGLLKSKKNPEN
jgi:multidrug transporter EmrE-like cation transporter